uniref:DUF4806 domain-containing protein n=1 Tax=Macrostomum lignano TaxID=282301 RepID=A0A1I8FKT1_9PLAT
RPAPPEPTSCDGPLPCIDSAPSYRATRNPARFGSSWCPGLVEMSAGSGPDSETRLCAGQPVRHSYARTDTVRLLGWPVSAQLVGAARPRQRPGHDSRFSTGGGGGRSAAAPTEPLDLETATKDDNRATPAASPAAEVCHQQTFDRLAVTRESGIERPSKRKQQKSGRTNKEEGRSAVTDKNNCSQRPDMTAETAAAAAELTEAEKLDCRRDRRLVVNTADAVAVETRKTEVAEAFVELFEYRSCVRISGGPDDQVDPVRTVLGSLRRALVETARVRPLLSTPSFISAGSWSRHHPPDDAGVDTFNEFVDAA